MRNDISLNEVGLEDDCTETEKQEDSLSEGILSRMNKSRFRLILALAVFLTVASRQEQVVAQAPSVPEDAKAEKMQTYYRTTDQAIQAYQAKQYRRVIDLLKNVIKDESMVAPPIIHSLYIAALSHYPEHYPEIKTLCSKERMGKHAAFVLVSKINSSDPDAEKGYESLVENCYTLLIGESIDTPNGIHLLVGKYIKKTVKRFRDNKFAPEEIFRNISQNKEDVILLIQGFIEIDKPRFADFLLEYCFDKNPKLKKDKWLKELANRLDGLAKGYLDSKGKLITNPATSGRVLITMLRIGGYDYKNSYIVPLSAK